MKRKYNSKSRQQQSQATQLKILEAARHLFSEEGIKKSTINKIAQRADVAPPTIYALFKSKAGIISQLGQTFVFGEGYLNLVKKSIQQADARESLKLAPIITVTIFEMEMEQMPFLWDDASITSELQDLISQLENQRYERQRFILDRLYEQEYLALGLTVSAARDILWALTGREMFKKMVIEKGWPHTSYKKWLEGTLATLLLQ
ncbi:TetR/AcrR family transcriptional regulator [Microbulbifer epialgicus]|uniref:TetR/AcrR family transcriptional regulator n=1 Tax=Microbulbifer epialgicus TaxID=393907 RepID=A0ABV4P555_9GAMM